MPIIWHREKTVKSIEQAVCALRSGEVIAYPTEAVFGLGCDPDNVLAIEKLLHIKQRPIEKGLILIAANYEQLRPYVDEQQLSLEQQQRVLASWPGPFTWIMPASSSVSFGLTGQFNSIAVRVSDHPLVQQLCLAYGKPITSTSANLSGLAPCRTVEEVERQLALQLGAIVQGETSGRTKPSEIRDAKTLEIVRQGQ